ncbi:toprim domain-containing protein [Pedobacter sp. ISL-68]|uniref:toprim domain-containing protein n=1 Tax=unclassified Pedobacter TaxID=2628915 RepID=UPI001BE69E2F|nr:MULTISPECIES: toprim domain-containing protein [unclassified Pedobacter]MBT2564691.1 toprim domain-containing protein [Pedobacter sp. ISL-64]MBT2592420.1 toprim domain-containing protein [Pedobacter sp. ISL-68]
MDFRNKKLSIEEAKEIDMVNYLSSLGHEFSKRSNNDFWYLSPLREEKTPSFKINQKLNRWYDHGLGKGGNLVDFGIEYHRCTVGELLDNLSGNLFLKHSVIHPAKIEDEPEHKIKVLRDFPLTSYPLLKYLEQRRIPIEIADKYCREVRYKLNDKTYYGIGFKNDSSGFEIRNPHFKASSSPKDITTFKNGSSEVVVFEGFIDFLSFKAIHKNLPENSQDFVVLNSVSFFERARGFMEEHQAIRLYLDRDATGQNCSQRALSMSTKYSDESNLYRNHKDLNDWAVNFGKSQKKHLGQKLR